MSFVNQGPSRLARLRELLPLMFDSHRIFTTEGKLSLLPYPLPADNPVPPGDIIAAGGLGEGAFDFLAAPAAAAGRETVREACVGNTKAFVRGGSEGLDRLRKVIPNIFRAFPDLPASDLLVECGLEPGNGEFPTFYFHPLLDGLAMVQAARIDRKRDDQELQERGLVPTSTLTGYKLLKNSIPTSSTTAYLSYNPYIHNKLLKIPFRHPLTTNGSKIPFPTTNGSFVGFFLNFLIILFNSPYHYGIHGGTPRSSST